MKNFKHILILFMLLNATLGFAQEGCDLAIPAGIWTGETSLKTEGTATKSQNFSVDGNTISISDFTAGFFDHYGYSGPGASIEIECDGSVVPTSVDSGSVGNVEITSGQLSEDNERLTLYWSIPSNKINHSTTFTYGS
ncbi:MAG: hypothetical protein HRT61_22525 [Ekhidna sp.]|nr:hypothetical protein [Ekhidna sp.]